MGEHPDHHFAAFSFVDRIDEFVPRTSARGRFVVPAGIDAFPPCLVAEAVGQLAAWISMEAVDFRGRPVAALAGETRFLGEVAPGSVLELAAELGISRQAINRRKKAALAVLEAQLLADGTLSKDDLQVADVRKIDSTLFN